MSFFGTTTYYHVTVAAAPYIIIYSSYNTLWEISDGQIYLPQAVDGKPGSAKSSNIQRGQMIGQWRHSISTHDSSMTSPRILPFDEK